MPLDTRHSWALKSIAPRHFGPQSDGLEATMLTKLHDSVSSHGSGTLDPVLCLCRISRAMNEHTVNHTAEYTMAEDYVASFVPAPEGIAKGLQYDSACSYAVPLLRLEDRQRVHIYGFWAAMSWPSNSRSMTLLWAPSWQRPATKSTSSLNTSPTSSTR